MVLTNFLVCACIVDGVDQYIDVVDMVILDDEDGVVVLDVVDGVVVLDEVDGVLVLDVVDGSCCA